MDEIKDKFLDEDLMEIFQSARILQKSHSKLLKTSITQHKALEKMTELLKLAGESHEKQNEMQKQTDRLIAQQQSVIDNFISVKQENRQLKEQIQTQEENCVALQKEHEIESEDLNEQLRVMNEIYEEKINKINDANLEKEYKIKNDWSEIQKNWEITKKELEEKLDDEKRNIAALNAEKNEVIKATIKKYEEQIKSLRESLENAKHEQEVLEKRNLDNIKIHEKKIEDLEKHYIKMMEDVSTEIKPTVNENGGNLVGNSNQNLKFNSLKVLGVDDVNKVNTMQMGRGNQVGNNDGSIYRAEENKMAATTTTATTKNRLDNLSNWQNSKQSLNFQYCQPNQSKFLSDHCPMPIKPILTSLSQFQYNERVNLYGAASKLSGKKITPLQSLPGDCHPLYAGNQGQVRFAPNSVEDSEPVSKNLQFPTKKRKL